MEDIKSGKTNLLSMRDYIMSGIVIRAHSVSNDEALKKLQKDIKAPYYLFFILEKAPVNLEEVGPNKLVSFSVHTKIDKTFIFLAPSTTLFTGLAAIQNFLIPSTPLLDVLMWGSIGLPFTMIISRYWFFYEKWKNWKAADFKYFATLKDKSKGCVRVFKDTL